MAKREPHFEQALKVIELCATREADGYLAAHTITNLFFILRKTLSVSERRNALSELCDMFSVVSIDSDKITSALKNHDFSDFEDCLQNECACEFNADYIVTRNVSDFKNSKIKAVEPSEFLKLIS
jgi:predicted nucleic acid-binding protein